MKTNFFEKNGIALLICMLVIFVMLALAQAACHNWLGVAADLVMALSIVVFALNMRVAGKRKQTICMLMDLVEMIARSKVMEKERKQEDAPSDGNKQETTPSDNKQEAEEDAAAKQKYLDSLVGLTIVETGKCDFCPNDGTDCKKLILADGAHICVKDMSKQPSKAE